MGYRLIVHKVKWNISDMTVRYECSPYMNGNSTEFEHRTTCKNCLKILKVRKNRKTN